MTIYNSITELVGKTPVIKLNSIVPEGSADVYVKLEAFNPGSSVKPAACQERAVHAGQASGPQGCRDACCF